MRSPSYINLLVDNAKIMTTLHDDCCGKLQKDLDKLNKLSHYWKDEFYAKKMQCPRDEGE